MNLEDLKNNLQKFSLPQMLSNNDGKTSASGTMGIIVCIAGTFAFLFGCIDFAFITNKNDIMIYSGGILTLGTSLLGVRKMKEKKSVSDEASLIANLPIEQK